MYLVVMQGALDETPSVIKLCLSRNMLLGQLFLVLQPQHLEASDWSGRH